MAESAAPSPTSGQIRDGVHTIPIRVYWDDTDAAGIVYYANYLKFFERGRSEMLRLLGVDQWRMKREEGINFVVRRCEVDYHAAAVLDDEIEVETRVDVLRGASLDMKQTVRRQEVDLVRAIVRVACVDATGRPVRLPTAIREALT